MNTNKLDARQLANKMGLRVVRDYCADGIAGETAEIVVRKGVVYLVAHVVLAEEQHMVRDSHRQVGACALLGLDPNEPAQFNRRVYNELTVDQKAAVDKKVFGYSYIKV